MNMTADEYLNNDIREEFAKHSSLFRTAKALGVTLERVKSVVGNQTFSTERKESTYGGRGRPELEPFIVATKSANEAWDNSSAELKQCRARYEAGTHEMCQGRDGDTIIQYSIPRATTEPKQGYFRSGAE